MNFGIVPSRKILILLCDTVISYSIPVFYDLLIAKMIRFGNNITEAIEKMKASLKSFRISGIPSTIPFHMSALKANMIHRLLIRWHFFVKRWRDSSCNFVSSSQEDKIGQG